MEEFEIRDAIFSPNGHLVATAWSHCQAVCGPTGASWFRHREVAYHRGLPTALAFSPDSKLLASGDETGQVIVCPIDPLVDWPAPVFRAQVQGIVYALALTGGLVAVGTENDVLLFSLTTGGELGRISPEGGLVHSLAWVSGGLLAVGQWGGLVRVYRVNTDAGTPLWTSDGPEGWLTWLVAAGGLIVVTGDPDGRVIARSVVAGDIVWAVRHPGPVVSLFASADGYLAVGGGEWVTVWDVVSGVTPVKALETHLQGNWDRETGIAGVIGVGLLAGDGQPLVAAITSDAVTHIHKRADGIPERR